MKISDHLHLLHIYLRLPWTPCIHPHILCLGNLMKLSTVVFIFTLIYIYIYIYTYLHLYFQHERWSSSCGLWVQEDKSGVRVKESLTERSEFFLHPSGGISDCGWGFPSSTKINLCEIKLLIFGILKIYPDSTIIIVVNYN